MLLGKAHTILPNTTLNTKYSIHEDVAPLVGEIPTLGFYCIGRGGHQVIMGSDSTPNIDAIPQFAQHSSLYNQLPFVLRPINSDLTAEERSKYALRRIETHNDVQYVAYYLKRLELSDVDINIEINQIDDGGESTRLPYSPDASNLNPVPLDIQLAAQQTDGDSLVVSAVVPIIMNEADADELRNVCAILYNDEKYAVVSEIGLCTGIDRTLLTPTSGDEVNMNEAIAVQINSYVSTFQDLNFNNKGFGIEVNIGSSASLSV